MATYYKKTKTGTWNKSKTTTTSRGNYTNLRTTWQQKISSYRTLCNQTQGTYSGKRPSAATLRTFDNWIGKGAIIHNVTASQINRWSHTGRKCSSATSAKSVLWHKFGKTPIKAVCKSKTGSYLVATTPMYKGKNFKFPH